MQGFPAGVTTAVREAPQPAEPFISVAVSRNAIVELSLLNCRLTSAPVPSMKRTQLQRGGPGKLRLSRKGL